MFPVLICWTYDYDEWIKFCLNQWPLRYRRALWLLCNISAAYVTGVPFDWAVTPMPLRYRHALQLRCNTNAPYVTCMSSGWNKRPRRLQSSEFETTTSKINKQRELISARKTSQEHSNKDLTRLRQLSPGMRVHKLPKVHPRIVSRSGLTVRR